MKPPSHFRSTNPAWVSSPSVHLDYIISVRESPHQALLDFYYMERFPLSLVIYVAILLGANIIFFGWEYLKMLDVSYGYSSH